MCEAGEVLKKNVMVLFLFGWFVGLGVQYFFVVFPPYHVSSMNPVYAEGIS